MAKKLYPNQEIFLGGFQNHGFNRDYDAFIGNPPYGEKKIADELNVNLNGLLVCDYFVAKSIQITKQDGIIASVVSDRFLDKTQNHVRELIAKEASFFGCNKIAKQYF
ncbi:Eco57I restriction-modification methylase domain-containing protein [Helicobacter bilis]|uniref:Eco57I restriction-modification methylase domain-containing protein n=1 Tax=Helicobacter bilis TaxID=37372 RepID=UPI003988F25C